MDREAHLNKCDIMALHFQLHLSAEKNELSTESAAGLTGTEIIMKVKN